jgi:hypothetical protein
MCISSMRPTTDIILSFQASIFNGLLEPCVRAARAAILRDLEQRWTEHIESVFEFELLVRWVPKEPDAACSVIKDMHRQ